MPGSFPCCVSFASGSLRSRPQSRGFLTGAVSQAESFPKGDYRRDDPRLQGANFDAEERIAVSVEAPARGRGGDPGAGGAGSGSGGRGLRRRAYLEENVGAANLALTAAEVAELDAAVPPPTGPRYTPAQMAQVDR